MTDPIEHLERLARLRESGALSEAEFQTQKSRLLGASDTPPQPDSAQGGPQSDGSKRKRWPWIALAGLVAAGTAGVVVAQFTAVDADRAGSADEQPGAAKPAAAAAAPAKPPCALCKLPEERQYALAEKAVFGSGTHEIRTAKQVVYSYDKGKLVWASFGPVLILPGADTDASPVTTGTLGIFYLEEKDGAFAVAKRWPAAAGGSIMGNPPEWSLSRNVASEPVIVSTAGGVWQGYSCATTTLTVLRSEGPADLVTFDAQYSDGGAKGEGEPSETIEGKLANVVKDRSFDVHYTGTRSFTHSYRRSGKVYQRLRGEGDDEVPQC